LRIEVTAKLIRMPDRTIVAQRNFASSAPAAQNEVAAIVDGFNQGFHAIARQLADWLPGAIPAAPAPRPR
jgi:ABC-type uncharacterized transport system auxiliary subunit